MERTPLMTAFVCVATAGKTADGREITAQQLTEMAETYDPKHYTANIWLEHYRWYGNFGQVRALEAREEEGKTKLYAQLMPSAEMMRLNKEGRGLFTSIEISPNFAGSGKAYLSGLAITDSPASTGTTQLMFSRVGTDNVIIGDHEPFTFSLSEPSNSATEQEQQGFFKKFSQWLLGSNENKNDEVPPIFSANQGNENHQENNNEMDLTQLSASITAAVANGINEAFAKQNTQPAPTEQVQTDTVSREEYNSLKQQFDELTKQFNQATQAVTETPQGEPAMLGQFSLNTAV